MPRTRTLKPIQFSEHNGYWTDMSFDDEHNMQRLGLTDPSDLPSMSRLNSQGHVEQYSQNQRNAEIKSSANIDILKKIFNTNSVPFEEARLQGQIDKERREINELKRQNQLWDEHADVQQRARDIEAAEELNRKLNQQQRI